MSSENEVQLNIEELQKEATELGITFRANTTAETLKKKIEEFYEAASKDVDPIELLPESIEDMTEDVYKTTKAAAEMKMRKVARELEAAARKTRVVVIIDNDQRTNSVSTSCTVNCSNAYFDLGTIILPLNVEVEVREGHLSGLSEVRIPQHVQDPNNPSISRTVMRPRYSIQTVTQFDTK